MPRSGSGSEEHEFKIALLAPEASAWGQSLKQAGSELQEKTGGQIRLKVYPSGVQGDERTVLRKMRIGQLQGAAFVGQGLALTCPDSLVLNLPLLFEDESEAEYVFEGMRSTLEESCRKNGYEVLAWSQMGFSYLFSQERVSTVDALRQAKPWLIEDDPLSRNLFDVLKVTPVPTATANVLTGLQTGLVRTIFSPPVALIALQWHSRVKYHLDVRISYTFGVFAIARDRWNRLPENLQRAMRSVFEAKSDELKEKIRVQNTAALKVIGEHGIETISVQPDSREQLARATEEVGERLAGTTFSRTALERAKALLEEYRQKHGKR